MKSALQIKCIIIIIIIITSLDVAAVGRVNVWYFREERHNFTAITYQKLQSLQVQNSCENLDVL